MTTPTTPTRLALVGAAEAIDRFAGVASHLPQVAIVAVVDADMDAARTVADALKAEHVINLFDTLLEDHGDQFDAMVIHASIPYRAERALKAVEAGKHVLIDSPLAPSVEEAQALTKAADSADVRLMVSQPKRFASDYAAVKKSLDDGKLGTPGLLRMHRWESPRGEGSLWKRVTRELDLALWLFQSLPSEVYCLARSKDDEPDYLQIHLGFTGGGMALIDYCQALPEGQPYESLTLVGSHGAAYADQHHNSQLLFQGDHPLALQTDSSQRADVLQLTEFDSAIREHRLPSISGADGQAVLQILLEAVAPSLDLGKAMRLHGGSYEPV